MSLKSFHDMKGTVVSAENGEALPKASITLTKTGDASATKYANVNTDGRFTMGAKGDESKGLTPGIYQLTVKCRGYKTVTQEVIVPSGNEDTVEIGTIKMVRGVYGNCALKGYVYDIATGRTTGVDLYVTLRNGINNTSSAPIDSCNLESDGQYLFNVPVGTYTITVEDKRALVSDSERYQPTSVTVVVEDDSAVQQNIYVGQAASENQIRIILTWGARPYDLDSHLLGPTGDGSSRFHTYYSNKSYLYNGKKYADLDLDDTSSYGPETTTIYYKNGSGVYSFYVHDFTNRSWTNSSALAESGATVKVYEGSALKETYKVPSDIGTVWHVFDYDAGTGALIPINTMSNQSSPGDVGTMSIEDGISQEERDLEIIFNDLEEK